MSEPTPRMDIPMDEQPDNVFEAHQPDNVFDFVPPEASNGPMKPELTRGMRLVGTDFNPSAMPGVALVQFRMAKTIDLLLDTELNIVQTEGGPAVDAEHKMIVEEALSRCMDASMWAVKALTWRK